MIRETSIYNLFYTLSVLSKFGLNLNINILQRQFNEYESSCVIVVRLQA